MDLFLDSLYVNAHTTASDALWLDLPILTCTGNTFAGRVATSILRDLQLSELITDNLASYEQRAIELGQDKQQLQKIREKLQKNKKTAPVFSTQTVVGSLEKVYLDIMNL